MSTNINTVADTAASRTQLDSPNIRINRYVYLNGITFDRLDLIAYRRGEPIDLTLVELKILNFLCRQTYNIYSSNEIAVGIGASTGESVKVHLCRMCKKPGLRRAIETVWGVGYRAVDADPDSVGSV